MNKKAIKKEQHVSMEKFLRDYVGIENELTISWLTSLTHKEFKEVCLELQMLDLTRISFDDVTREDVQRGDVLLVLDKDNNTAPYTNPNQGSFSMIMEEERKRQDEMMYDAKRHMQTFDEYVDTLDEVALDKGISHQKIKELGSLKTIERVNDND